MMSLIRFRPVKENDFPAICQLIESKQELFLVYPSATYPLTIEQLEHIAKIRKDLTIAEFDTRIIGFANFYNFEPKHKAFIGNLIIERSQRGKGLGKKLLKHMLKLAFQQHELKEVHISVFSENTKALLLYYSLGFTPYDMEKRVDSYGSQVALLHMKTCADKVC